MNTTRICVRCQTTREIKDFIHTTGASKKLCNFCKDADAESDSTKKCDKCLEIKPIAYFGVRKGIRHRYCTECIRSYTKDYRKKRIHIRVVSKTCLKCHCTKSSNDFYRNADSSDGLAGWCRECTNQSSKGKDQTAIIEAGGMVFTFGYIKHAARSLKLKYPDILMVLRSCDGKCQICDSPFKSKSDIMLDHDHSTNKPRGLLCMACNIMLGHCKNDPAILLRGAAYLNRT